MMTPQERIDAALDSVLKAAGSALKNYTLPGNLETMRDAMRKIMSDSYISGSNAAQTEPLEVPDGCMEWPGFILVIEPGKSWLTSAGEVTNIFGERGVWETLEAAEQAKESFFG